MTISDRIKLPGDAELVHTTDQWGNRVSMIVKDGVEVWACYIRNEKDMIDRWCAMHEPEEQDDKRRTENGT